IFDGRAETRPPGDWAQEEKLFQREFAQENGALAEAELALQVEAVHNRPAHDDVFDIWRIFGDSVDYVIAEGLFLIVPVQAWAELVGRVLHEARHYVLSRRRDRGIRERGNDHIDIRALREISVLSVVVGAFDVFDRGRAGNRSRQVCAWSRHAFEVGQRIQREIYFA